MKRRNFLKGILASPAIVAVPVLAKTNGSIGIPSIGGHEIEQVESWQLIDQSEIDLKSPITKSLQTKLGGNRETYSRSDVIKLTKQREKINAVIKRRKANQL